MADQERSDETEEPERRRRSDAGTTRDREPSGESIVDLARQPIVTAWTTYLTLLFALVAVGFGLFEILRDAVDEEIVEVSDGGAAFDAAFEAAFSIPLVVTPYLGILIAVFVGAFLGWRLRRDRSTTYVAAGLCTGVGTFTFWLLAGLFGSIPLDNASLDIGGLIVNAVFAGIAAGVVAVAGVWATRTRAPIEIPVTGPEDRRES